MNRYKITIPYSYVRYGDLIGYINAASQDDAWEEANAGYLEDEDYEDSDHYGENDYDYHDMEIELVEEDINGDEENNGYISMPNSSDVPAPYYLEEINKV